MSTLGKILIAFQVVLSILFMMFAGAVAHTHETWKKKFEDTEKSLKQVTETRETLRNEFKTFQATAEADKKAADGEKQKAIATAEGLKTERDQLLKEKKALTDEKAQALQAASVAADEAKARVEEAKLLLEVNEKLQNSRDELWKLKQTLEDKIRGQQVDLNIAAEKIKTHIDEIVALRKKVATATMSNSVADAASSDIPPPVQVEGKITETRPAKSAGASELVAISIGSDDGLQKGHTLIVYRPIDENNKLPKYICQIRVLTASPQTSVAEVIKSTRTGVIQKGDHVATKL